MANAGKTITVRIALDGSSDIKQQLADIGAEGQKASKQFEDAANAQGVLAKFGPALDAIKAKAQAVGAAAQQVGQSFDKFAGSVGSAATRMGVLGTAVAGAGRKAQARTCRSLQSIRRASRRTPLAPRCLRHDSRARARDASKHRSCTRCAIEHGERRANGNRLGSRRSVGGRPQRKRRAARVSGVVFLDHINLCRTSSPEERSAVM